MARLIAFDQKTAAALRQQMPQHQIFEHGASDVVDFAVAGPETLVSVLSVDAPGEAGVAVFRRPRIERVPVQTPETKTSSVPEVPGPRVAQPLSPSSHAEEPVESAAVRIRAGGFLGLRDEAVFEEEQKPPEKRGWWNKFWNED